MHKTEAGEKVKALKKEAQELARRAKAQKEAAATMRAARVTVTNLQSLAAKKLSQAQAQKLEARLEDLTVWQMEKTKTTKKGCRSYRYWMANWREGGKVRNVHLGGCNKMDEVTAGRRQGRSRPKHWRSSFKYKEPRGAKLVRLKFSGG